MEPIPTNSRSPCALGAETLSGAHHLPPGDAIANISEIANAFDEQQAFDIRLLALTTGGDGQLAARAEDANLAALANEQGIATESQPQLSQHATIDGVSDQC